MVWMSKYVLLFYVDAIVNACPKLYAGFPIISL